MATPNDQRSNNEIRDEITRRLLEQQLADLDKKPVPLWAFLIGGFAGGIFFPAAGALLVVHLLKVCSR